MTDAPKLPFLMRKTFGEHIDLCGSRMVQLRELNDSDTVLGIFGSHSLIDYFLDERYSVENDEYELPQEEAIDTLQSNLTLPEQAEARFVYHIVLNSFAKVATQDDWDTANTGPYLNVLLFDDASLTPNSPWEHVIESNVVQALRYLILHPMDELVKCLMSQNLFLLRDTEHHRQQAVYRSFQLRTISKMYRFSASEIKTATRRRLHLLMEYHVIESTHRFVQCYQWKKLCSSHRIAKHPNFPDNPVDMYIIMKSGAIIGAVLASKQSSIIHEFLANNSVVFWSLLNALLKSKLFDEDYCFKICLSLLSPRLRDQVLAEGGTYLHSISVGHYDPVEVIEVDLS